MTEAAGDLVAMRQALDLAVQAGDLGELPVGAVVLNSTGDIVGAAGNAREARHDPTAHAEILALRQAGERAQTWRLTQHTLVVTLEPCPMCAGAAVAARVGRVVFGAWNTEYGAAGSHWDLIRDRRLSHRPEVVSGVLAEECGTLVREFLARRR